MRANSIPAARGLFREVEEERDDYVHGYCNGIYRVGPGRQAVAVGEQYSKNGNRHMKGALHGLSLLALGEEVQAAGAIDRAARTQEVHRFLGKVGREVENAIGGEALNGELGAAPLVAQLDHAEEHTVGSLGDVAPVLLFGFDSSASTLLFGLGSSALSLLFGVGSSLRAVCADEVPEAIEQLQDECEATEADAAHDDHQSGQVGPVREMALHEQKDRSHGADRKEVGRQGVVLAVVRDVLPVLHGLDCRTGSQVAIGACAR